MRGLFFASVLLAAGVAPLACYLAGRLGTRWIILSALLYVCVTGNTVIEARIFTTLFAKGGAANTALYAIFPSLAGGAALAAWIRPRASWDGSRSGLAAYISLRESASWTWRLLGALLAFPVVYFLFGMAVGPIVVP